MKTPKPVAPILTQNILTHARAYAAHRGVKMLTVSTHCHGDPPFLDKLAAGKCSFTIRKYDEIMVWFAANWPAGLKRPKIVRA